MMKPKLRQLGQSMTEYIIIVALLAIAGIAIYGLFGDSIRGQMNVTTSDLAGDKGSSDVTTVTAKAGDETANHSLKDLPQGTQ